MHGSGAAVPVSLSAAMAAAAWAPIREAIRATGVVVEESGVITQDIGRAVVVNMGSMADLAAHMSARMEQMESVLTTIGMRIDSDINTFNDRLDNLQSAVDSSRDRHTHRKHGILESKSVQSIKNLGSDKGGFRTWNEKLINIVSQIRPGSRKLFAAMGEFVDKDNDLDEGLFRQDFTESGGLGDMTNRGTKYEDMSEDLFVLLTDRTEGEAAIRVRGC